ncbi:hypothetical protein COCON_G00057670 [Conger conger]|uniref:Uncharacterized protein n=1 Tax=Conger conger TaxID=82655 RepID=A0A9Q1DQV2_CONCO|nr:hypothetical protein COCON_G00057670 [Conger conger]
MEKLSALVKDLKRSTGNKTRTISLLCSSTRTGHEALAKTPGRPLLPPRLHGGLAFHGEVVLSAAGWTGTGNGCLMGEMLARLPTDSGNNEDFKNTPGSGSVLQHTMAISSVTLSSPKVEVAD